MGPRRRKMQEIWGVNMETTLKVSGMHCASCEKIISMSAEDVPGVKVLFSDHKTGAVRVYARDEKALIDIKKAIRLEGYKVE